MKTWTMGKIRLHLLDGGRFALDGGAMFGVVPRTLWSRHISPDERNRIPMASHPLLIETPDTRILVDTGLGLAWEGKRKEIYAVEPQDPLEGTPFRPEDVDLVVLTHLHFDHTGGSTRREDDRWVPAYPRATYLVQQRELADALFPHERNRASYFPETFRPLWESGRLKTLSGKTEVAPGVWAVPVPGHTPGHQIVLVESEGKKAAFLADFVPTRHHFPLPYIMGYDLEPLRSLEMRKLLYPRMIRERWLLLLEHDREATAGLLVEGERGVQLEVLPPEA